MKQFSRKENYLGDQDQIQQDLLFALKAFEKEVLSGEIANLFIMASTSDDHTDAIIVNSQDIAVIVLQLLGNLETIIYEDNSHLSDVAKQAINQQLKTLQKLVTEKD